MGAKTQPPGTQLSERRLAGMSVFWKVKEQCLGRLYEIFRFIVKALRPVPPIRITPIMFIKSVQNQSKMNPRAVPEQFPRHFPRNAANNFQKSTKKALKRMTPARQKRRQRLQKDAKRDPKASKKILKMIKKREKDRQVKTLFLKSKK